MLHKKKMNRKDRRKEVLFAHTFNMRNEEERIEAYHYIYYHAHGSMKIKNKKIKGNQNCIRLFGLNGSPLVWINVRNKNNKVVTKRIVRKYKFEEIRYPTLNHIENIMTVWKCTPYKQYMCKVI